MSTKFIREEISKKKNTLTYSYELQVRTFEGIRSELLGCDDTTRKWNGSTFIDQVPFRDEVIEFSGMQGFKVECQATRQTIEHSTNGKIFSTESTIIEKHIIGPLTEIDAVTFTMTYSHQIAKHKLPA